jgi:hypothetical protein
MSNKDSNVIAMIALRIAERERFSMTWLCRGHARRADVNSGGAAVGLSYVTAYRMLDVLFTTRFRFG